MQADNDNRCKAFVSAIFSDKTPRSLSRQSSTTATEYLQPNKVSHNDSCSVKKSSSVILTSTKASPSNVLSGACLSLKHSIRSSDDSLDDQNITSSGDLIKNFTTNETIFHDVKRDGQTILRNDWNKDCSPKQANRSDKRSIQGSKDHQTRVEGFELIKQSTQDKLVEETDPINTKSKNQEEDFTDNLSKSVNTRKEIERIQKTNKILKENIIVHSEAVVLSFENQELSKLVGICKSIGKTEEDIDRMVQKGFKDDNLEHKIEQVEKNKTKLPDHLRHDYFDAMIFYIESDRKVATVFCEQLKSLELKHPLKPILYDDTHLDYVTNSKLEQLRLTCDNSMFIFVLVTETFNKNRKLPKNDDQSTNDDKDSDKSDIYEVDNEINRFFDEIVHYCLKETKIIPVRTKQGLQLPFGVSAVKPLDFYNLDEQYIKELNHQFSKSDAERRKKETQFIEKQYKCISNMSIPNVI